MRTPIEQLLLIHNVESTVIMQYVNKINPEVVDICMTYYEAAKPFYLISMNDDSPNSLEYFTTYVNACAHYLQLITIHLLSKIRVQPVIDYGYSHLIG